MRNVTYLDDAGKPLRGNALRKFRRSLLRIEHLARAIREAQERADISRLWRAFFAKVLYDWGFNKTAIDALFGWGSNGHNWQALWSECHPTSTNPKKRHMNYGRVPARRFLEDFKGEVGYIYDRLSLDRLFRTHWLYNQWMMRTEPKVKK